MNTILVKLEYIYICRICPYSYNLIVFFYFQCSPQFYDGGLPTSPSLGDSPYCNSQTIPSLTTSGPYAYVHFVSDESASGGGFNITYTSSDGKTFLKAPYFLKLHYKRQRNVFNFHSDSLSGYLIMIRQCSLTTTTVKSLVMSVLEKIFQFCKTSSICKDIKFLTNLDYILATQF